MGLSQFLTNRRMLKLVLGTAGTWFLFDYAYYGNTLSLPSILKNVSPHASIETKLVWTLGLFVVFALPGYLLAVAKMDRIGHRRLQLIGFAVMAACFVALGAVPALTASVGPFLAIFGLSYFFTEFGPNTTTFVLPSEVFPVSMRTTGHGIAAGVGKLGAFIGVFLVPQLQKNIGLRGMLTVAGVAAVLGLLLTRVLPEPAQRSLEDVSGEDDHGFLVLPIDPMSTSSIPERAHRLTLRLDIAGARRRPVPNAGTSIRCPRPFAELVHVIWLVDLGASRAGGSSKKAAYPTYACLPCVRRWTPSELCAVCLPS